MELRYKYLEINFEEKSNVSHFSKKTHKNKRKRKRQEEPIKEVIEYTWILYCFLGENTTPERGHFYRPNNEIGDSLTNENVCYLLNSSNCFNFHYEPAEKDNLLILYKDGNRLEFVFKEGKWTIDYLNPFFDLYEEKTSGIVKVV